MGCRVSEYLGGYGYVGGGSLSSRGDISPGKVKFLWIPTLATVVTAGVFNL